MSVSRATDPSGVSTAAFGVLPARPLVSVVTPSLNQGRFIAQTLRSVAGQSYGDIEHVVIDGGSTDDTLVILEHAGTNSRMTWTSAPDRGMYDAVNKGLRTAKGEIVTYLNSDDFLLPWAIETVVAAFVADPGLGLLYGDALSLDETSGTIGLQLQVDFRRERIARFGSVVQPSVFWRRGIEDTIGPFDSELEFVGDLDFWLRASGVTRVKHIAEVLSVFRTHPAAKTTRQRSAMRREERLMRARHHRDGVWTGARQLRARISHGVDQRRQMVRFAAALRRASDRRWIRFRQEFRPKLRLGSFLIAVLPIAGRVVHPLWLDFRGPMPNA